MQFDKECGSISNNIVEDFKRWIALNYKDVITQEELDWEGKDIVNYNPGDFLGIRMLTIPIEDAVYGYTQFLLGLYFFKKFQNQNV